MTSLVDRVILVCGNTRHRTMDCCVSIRSAISEKRVKTALVAKWRSLVDQATLTRRRAGLFVRNLVAQLMDPEGQRSLRQQETTSMSNPKPDGQHYQPLEELGRPQDYFGKCKTQSSAPTWKMLVPRNKRGGGERGTPAESMEAEFSLPESFGAEELEQYLVCAIHSSTLNSQMQSIPREDVTRSKSHAEKPSNIKKNRYKNNTPYDDTRVVLKGDAESDYINACYIEGSGGPRDFIATQGPKEMNDRTIDDFWRMVWQNNSNIIVMVGNLIEDGRGKVSQYWPNHGVKETYWQLEVETKAVKQNVNWVRRHLLVSLGAQSREVVQYHFIAWPDHDVPVSPYGAACMVKKITMWKWTGPPIIHCSAGLGRTGAILLVLRLLDDLRCKGRFHPLNTLRSLRKCRANLLDNEHQYRFAQHVVLEVLYGHKTRFSVHKESTERHLFNQYMELRSVPHSFTYNWARSHDAGLNRDNSVLPPDGRHIPLPVKDSTPQYLNAVRVRDSNLRDTFIVTEHPMSQTLGTCWKLAYLTRTLVWIILHHHHSNNEDFPSVLPYGASGQLEGITVEVTGKTDHQFFTENSITTISQGEPHKMQLIQFKNWSPMSDLPNPLQSLVFLVERVQEIRRSSPGKIIMVSCSDGYSASGVFVSLVRMVAEIELTNSMDVYRTVQSVHFDRPQFIISQNQYSYLHDASIIYFKLQVLRKRKTKQQMNKKKQIPTGGSDQQRENTNRERQTQNI